MKTLPDRIHTELPFLLSFRETNVLKSFITESLYLHKINVSICTCSIWEFQLVPALLNYIFDKLWSVTLRKQSVVDHFSKSNDMCYTEAELCLTDTLQYFSGIGNTLYNESEIMECTGGVIRLFFLLNKLWTHSHFSIVDNVVNLQVSGF